MISFDCTLTRHSFALNVAFEADSGLVALFGPSGAGKSTILRLIAGLERPDSGQISVAGETLFDHAHGINIPASKRGIGFVFQDGQLFPHLSVQDNLCYGTRFAGTKRPRLTFADAVELLGLGHVLERKPATLSGGERQRVAIGRALLAAPRILLMDEPFASLDQARKSEIMPVIEQLRDEAGLPIVYVSHARDEVIRLATKVVRLEHGNLIASGTADDVFQPSLDDPAGRFDAASFISAKKVRYDDAFDVTIFTHAAGEIIVPGTVNAAVGETKRIAISATNVALSPADPKPSSIRTSLAGTIIRIEQCAEFPHALVAIELTGGDRLAAYITRLAAADLKLTDGMPVTALIKSVSLDETTVA